MAEDLSPEVQAALAGGGGTGGLNLNEGKPTPGSTRWRLENGYIVQDVANADGIWSVNTNVQPQPFLPGTGPKEGAPHTLKTDDGYIQWDPEKGWLHIAGTEPAPKPPTYQQIGNTIYEFGPGGIKPAFTDQGAIAAQQAKAEAEARAEAERTRQFDLTHGLNVDANTRAALTLMNQVETTRLGNEYNLAALDETRANNQFNQNYKAFVDLPYQQVQDERAAQTARLGAAAQAGTYAAQRASEGRQAGQDVVSTMLQTLPYRVRPEWNQQFLAAHNAEMTGQPIPAYTEAALGFQAPNLEGARAAANTQAQAALPTYDQLVAGAPQFPGMSPEDAQRYQRMLLGLPYQPVVA